MNTNCLVTKLKGTVDNNNLPIYNQVDFIVPAGSTTWLNIGAFNGTTLKASGDVTFAFGDGVARTTFTCVSESANAGVTVSGGANGGRLSIIGKYNCQTPGVGGKAGEGVTSFAIVGGNRTPEDYKFWFTGYYFAATPLKGDIKTIKECLPNLTELQIQSNCKMTGNISDLSANLTAIVLGNPLSINSADIADLAHCTNLIRLFIYTPLITGSLDDLAQAQASSRTEGSTLTVKSNGLLTYKVNGEDTIIPNNTNKTITFSGGSYTIA